MCASSAAGAASCSSLVRGTYLDQAKIKPYLDALFQASDGTRESLYQYTNRVMERPFDRYAIEDLGVPTGPTKEDVDKAAMTRFRVCDKVLVPLRNVIGCVELVVENVALVVLKGLFLLGPINIANHLIGTILGGVNSVCMLGYNYQILLNHIESRLMHLKWLVDRNFVEDGNCSTIMTTTSWAAEFLALPPGGVAALQVAYRYLLHPKTARWMTKEGIRNVENWINNVGPTSPFKPVESTIRVPSEVINAFPPRVPERFPQRLVYNHDSQHLAYWHNQMATSIGQSSDWVPPSPSLALRRTPSALQTAGHEPEESVSTRCSRMTCACGMDTLHQELDADSQAAPWQLTL
jgi:hypothetical protein